jgi:glycosyltransferase involved in cell wall biosynthesis
MKIAIATPVLIDGDAVSNDVVGMSAALRKAGYEVQIFVHQSFAPGVAVKPIDKVEEFLGREDFFVYHFSVGWDLGFDLTATLRCRKIIKYHNVTPPEYFEGVNEEYAAVCRAGRNMLPKMAAISADLFLSDSEYNMAELLDAGAPRRRNFVVPPFHHIDRLLEADADLSTLARVRDGHTNILMVGRLAPNKGHVALVEAFARYHYDYNRSSRLIIVGKQDPRLSNYLHAIHEAIARVELRDKVVFTGEVSEEQLKAYYLAAQVFSIASEHEGFCVPVVEAMAHHVPVAAYASTALTKTLGTAGIVWEERDPDLLAASINEIATNSETATGLGEAGWERYRTHFGNDIIETRFLEVLRGAGSDGLR